MQVLPKILFLDKVLLAELKKPVRGVEIFNINLLYDLSKLQYDITVPLHKSWIKHLKETHPDKIQDLKIVNCSISKSALGNGLAAIYKNKKQHFDIMIVANIANSLIPAIKLCEWRKMVDKYVLIAHREPSRRFLATCNSLGKKMTIITVNKKIESHFDKKIFDAVTTKYGITNAELYFPPDKTTKDNQPFRFCVVGQLDNKWKGADTAVEAFRKIPESTRNKCELHLASFTEPPAYPENNIITYNWMPADEIPSFLRKMDVMLVPSRDEVVMRETFSQVIVQGMLTALPICASNLPILTEKLDNGGGFIFDNTDTLAKQMIHLANNRDIARETGLIARQTAKERYIWDTAEFAQLFL